MLFLQTTIKRTVRGSLTSGKKPYIQFEGVEYRSDKLAHSAHLINQEVTLHVNVDDIRTIKVFLEDGSEFGYLTAAGKWSLTPHSLTTRRAINSLALRKLIHYTTWDDPIFVYTDYLMKNALKGNKRAINKVTSVQEAAVKEPIDAPEEQTQVINEAKVHNEALEKAREMTKRQQHQNEVDHYEQMLSRFKTKSL
nr:Mu transposase C-terminal domain-containing protein [Paenibacillus phyllosphaerae]